MYEDTKSRLQSIDTYVYIYSDFCHWLRTCIAVLWNFPVFSNFLKRLVCPLWYKSPRLSCIDLCMNEYICLSCVVTIVMIRTRHAINLSTHYDELLERRIQTNKSNHLKVNAVWQSVELPLVQQHEMLCVCLFAHFSLVSFGIWLLCVLICVLSYDCPCSSIFVIYVCFVCLTFHMGWIIRNASSMAIVSIHALYQHCQ